MAMHIKSIIVIALLFFLPSADFTLAARVEGGPERLRVVALREFPPQYLVDEAGRPGGFAIETIEAVARLAGFAVDYQVVDTWDQALEALRQGRADVIPNSGITSDRLAEFDFTPPLETFDLGLFVRDSTQDIRSQKDLAGHRVAVVKDNAGQRLALSWPKSQVKVYDHSSEALLDLLAGQVDAFVYPTPVVRFMLARASLAGRVKQVGPSLVEIKRGIAVKKGRIELLSRLDQAVVRFVSSAEYRRIYSKWYGSPDPMFSTPMAVTLMAALLMLALLAVAWRYHSISRLTKRLAHSLLARDEAEMARRKSELKFQHIFENMQDGYILADLEGRIEMVNPAAAAILGYAQPAEMVGLNMVAEVMLDDREREGIMARLEEKGFVLGLEQEFVTKDGETIVTESNLRLVSGEDGDPRAVEGVFRDITKRKQAETKLKESERRFRLLFERVFDALVMVDTKGRVINMNQSACRLLGYDTAEVGSLDLSEIHPPAELARVMAALKRVLERGADHIGETAMLTKGGREVPVEGGLVAVTTGGQTLIINSFRDITERKRAEEGIRAAQEELEQRVMARTAQLAQAYQDLTWEAKVNAALADVANTLLDVNSSLTHISEIVLEKARQLTESGHGYVSSIDTKTGDNVVHTFTRMLEHSCRVRPGDQRTVFPRRPDGTYPALWGHSLNTGKSFYTHSPQAHQAAGGLPEGHIVLESFLSYNVMNGDRAVGQIALANTRREYGPKDMEALSRLARLFSLALQRNEASEQLQDAKAAAEAANQAKTRFLANMSHEIRTPMNAIMGLTDLVLSSSLDEAQRQHLEAVRSSADHLLELIEDLLDLSKIEAGRVTLESRPFRLRASLAGVITALAAKARQKGLELIHQVLPETPDRLVGDARRLRQVLINLVGNAIKFTQEGEVLVQVGLARLTADRAVLAFAVTDTGVGVAKEKQAEIFERFAQADETIHGQYGGTGLGLAITRQIVSMMGGEISVDSDPGQGATFGFSAVFGLDLAEPGQADAVPGAVVPGRVLLAEDNRINQKIVTHLLENMGFEVVSAMDGAQAVEQWRANGPFDLILMDLGMPVMDGYEAAMRIRAEEEPLGRRTPIAAMTGFASGEDRARSQRRGLDAHLTKPLDPDELKETLRALLGD